MIRRTLLGALASAAARPVLAQPAVKQARVGFIEPGTPQSNGPFLTSFRAGMASRGWVEGQNLTIVARWVENRTERLPELVAAVLAEKIDILVTAGSVVTKGALAAKAALPIVFVGVGDPVAFGLVQSLARPGGNVTGLSNVAVDLLSKRLQLLLEVAPAVKRIAVLTDAADPTGTAYWQQIREDTARLGLSALLVEASTRDDIDREFARMAGRADAVFVAFNALMVANRAQIAALALANRLPTSCPIRDFVVAGGLQSLGSNLSNDFRRAADFVDRILRGAKPAELPVEQPTVFELAINLKTARALGLALPPTLLARADELIE
jgi:putative tryptophan/tyrosine transport system substrate-binding protein